MNQKLGEKRSRIGDGGPIKRRNDEPLSESETKERWSAWQIWKEFWAFVGPLATVLGIWLNLTPVLSVEPSVNVDPSKQYATQILITNRGNIPVYDLEFGCGFGTKHGTTVLNFAIGTAPLDLSPVSDLSPRRAITRSCSIPGEVKGDDTVAFTVKFGWPILGHFWRQEIRTTFRVLGGQPGYFLVPD